MSSLMQEEASTPAPALFEQLENYAWDQDAEFRSGLNAILGSATTPEQKEELSLRARCFYFARKYNTHIDFDQYASWRAQNIPSTSSTEPENKLPWQTNTTATVTTASGDEADAAPKMSYQEIVDLIQSGKPVPGIKEIPTTVLAGQGTTAAKERRRKPWEKDTPAPSGETMVSEASAEVSA